MSIELTRRHCLFALPAAAFGLAPRASGVLVAQPTERTGLAASMPSHDPALVHEMVGASHGRIERVRELLKETPQLANAAIDWGFGDWETALGAASHTGRREIAALLMEHGARPDVFTLCMLGVVDGVRAMIQAQPGLQRTGGPHGISMLAHARAGGEHARAVVEYLTALGDADMKLASVPLDGPARRAYVGSYSFGPFESDRFNVIEEKDALWIRRVERPLRGLTHIGEHTFVPVGAPDVRIIFTMNAERATLLRITTPKPIVEATLVG